MLPDTECHYLPHCLELAFGLLDSPIYINFVAVHLLLKMAAKVFDFIGVRFELVIIDSGIRSCCQ